MHACSTPRRASRLAQSPCPLSLQVKPPLRIASFIVRRPCFTALGSLFVAVILASEGNRAGFSGAEELSDIFPQQDYPVYDTISQQTDAVIMAMEQSEENFALRSRRRALSSRFTAPSATGARRFLSSSGVQHLQRAAARFDGAEMGDRAGAGAGEPAFERGRELSSTPINQTKQTESLGEAIFSFGAREDGGDSFSEAGLAELCRMHVEMMETKDYDKYCLRSEFETPDVGVLPDATCKAPRTPLVFFYGAGVVETPRECLGTAAAAAAATAIFSCTFGAVLAWRREGGRDSHPPCDCVQARPRTTRSRPSPSSTFRTSRRSWRGSSTLPTLKRCGALYQSAHRLRASHHSASCEL